MTSTIGIVNTKDKHFPKNIFDCSKSSIDKGLQSPRMPENGSPQKNLRLGEPLVAAFEDWCDSRGLDEKKVFLTGWMLLAQSTPAQRTDAFKQVNAWIAGGFQTDDGDAGESGDGALRAPPKPKPAPIVGQKRLRGTGS